MNESFIEYILAAVIAAAIVGLIVAGLSIPEVVISSSTNECIRADDPYSCDDLPEKYSLIWSE